MWVGKRMHLAPRLLKKNLKILPIALELEANISKCVTPNSSKHN
jgi:hypothetical protein